jgi:hypothetical protein
LRSSLISILFCRLNWLLIPSRRKLIIWFCKLLLINYIHPINPIFLKEVEIIVGVVLVVELTTIILVILGIYFHIIIYFLALLNSNMIFTIGVARVF